MFKFIDLYNYLRLNKEEMENLNELIKRKETKVKTLPKEKQNSRTRLLHKRCDHTFKGELNLAS